MVYTTLLEISCTGSIMDGRKAKVAFCVRTAKPKFTLKLEDLMGLKGSPDLLNNVKIGQAQLQLIMKQILFYEGCSHFGQVT